MDGGEEEVRGELKELAAAETSAEYGTEDSSDGEKEPGREWVAGEGNVRAVAARLHSMGETSGASGGGGGGDADVEGTRKGLAAGGAEVPGAAGFLANLPWARGWRV